MSNSSSSIRNVAFVGVNKSGKTSLVETILHLTGAINRRGKSSDGTMTTDYEPEAIARQMSTSVSFAHTVYGDTNFNIIDCPGFVDLSEEVKLALIGADIAVFVVEPDPSRLIQMDSLLRYTEELGIARMIFVNKLDKPDVNFSDLLLALRSMSSSKGTRPLTLLQYPLGTDSNFSGYVDILQNKVYQYGPQGGKELSAIPVDLQSEIASAREKLIEALADTDDAVLEMVIDNNEISPELLEKDLKEDIKTGAIVPILVGSAHTDGGIWSLLNSLISWYPSPADRQYKDKNGKLISVSDSGPVIAQVIKTYIHPQSGKLSVSRVFSGTIKADAHLSDITGGGNDERIGGLYWLLGKKQEPMQSAGPGSIVAISRLESAHTGDTLVAGKTTQIMPTPPTPPTLYALAIAAKSYIDETKLSPLLHKLTEEDPFLKADRDPDTNEYCLYGQGEVHLALGRHRLERKYNIQLECHLPQTAYRETIQIKVDAHGRHKKQSGGHGQFGEVSLQIKPQERGSGNRFSESIVGGSVPRQYIPGVEKGIMEALHKGPLAGFPVVDVSVNLYDGSFHEVDSDEMSFHMAAISAVREGLNKAHPIILEPIYEVLITVPNSYTAGVLSQIPGLRGQILGYGRSMTHFGWDEVSAHIPQAELWNYIIELRTLSQGLGFYTSRFSYLSLVPPHVSSELMAKYAKEIAAHTSHG